MIDSAWIQHREAAYLAHKFALSPARRQEALATFILSAQASARHLLELRKILDECRMYLDLYQEIPAAEELALYAEKCIVEHMRKVLGVTFPVPLNTETKEG